MGGTSGLHQRVRRARLVHMIDPQAIVEAWITATGDIRDPPCRTVFVSSAPRRKSAVARPAQIPQRLRRNTPGVKIQQIFPFGLDPLAGLI